MYYNWLAVRISNDSLLMINMFRVTHKNVNHVH